jgi:hypothetical protein
MKWHIKEIYMTNLQHPANKTDLHFGVEYEIHSLPDHSA